MSVRIAINGFGRIGRNVVRALYESGRRAEVTVVAINELADAAGMAHLLKYDTSHGRFAWDVHQEREQLFVGDDAIRILHQRDIAALPWRELGVDVVLDCTGVFGSRADGEAHLAAGAKKVLFSHPGSNDLDATVVFGVNQDALKPDDRIVSNASCTTNCIIPIIKLLDDAWGIESGTVTTIHSAMHDQQVIDAYHPDLRRTPPSRRGRCRRGGKRALFSPPPEDGLHRVHDSRIRRYSQARRPPPVRARATPQWSAHAADGWHRRQQTAARAPDGHPRRNGHGWCHISINARCPRHPPAH